MRTAFQHLAWNLDLGLAGIVAVLCARSARIGGNAAILGGIVWMLWLIPVRRPFPDVADGVVEPKAVRRIRSNRRRSLVTVARYTLPGKFSLPGVRHVTVVR